MKEVAAALQELKSTRAHVEKEEERPSDITFSNQAESVSRACEDLSQQVKINLSVQLKMENFVLLENFCSEFC